MFPKSSLLTLAFLAAAANAQQVGTLTAENHPALTWQLCTGPGACTTQQSSVVLDSNWRWLHSTSGATNCYTGNQWNAALCPDPTTCATNCALDGADYSGTYGITTSGSALNLNFVTGSNVGSRMYLMAPGSTSQYQIFKPNNREFTMDVDVSQLPCGLNGAVYFSQMDADGGVGKFPANKAGAKYGTGYCDSQCPMDLKFINGQANMQNWNATSANSGTGTYGACCPEMDIWEANSISEAYTAHPCSVSGLTKCSGDQCSILNRHGGLCDPDGCDFNSYRMGNTGFYGPGKTIDTTKPITVVTQFITNDGTDSGTLSNIKRIYVQNGVVYANSMSNVAGVTASNSLTDSFCTQQKTAFGDTNVFSTNGGIAGMGKANAAGMVLVLSIWDDYAANMLWLDSDYPTTGNAATPGIARGTCATSSGVPATVEGSPAKVTYSNIKFGPINSTYTGTPGGGGTTTTTTKGTGTTSTTSLKTSTTHTTTTTASGSQQTHYGQCGGTGYSGPTTCASPYTCTYSNPYYSQCL